MEETKEVSESQLDEIAIKILTEHKEAFEELAK